MDRDAAAITLESLAVRNPDAELVPKLAMEIPSWENGGITSEGGAIIWNLKPNVKWSDGGNFTADDVVFTWEYCSHPVTGCVAFPGSAWVTGVYAQDDFNVLIRFKPDLAYLFNVFTSAGNVILQRSQFADCIGEAALQCVEQNFKSHGTGPYRLVDFKRNAEAIYERNPYYHGAAPFFDKVVFQGGGDATTAARAVLETGEADYGWHLQVESRLLEQLAARSCCSGRIGARGLITSFPVQNTSQFGYGYGHRPHLSDGSAVWIRRQGHVP